MEFVNSLVEEIMALRGASWFIVLGALVAAVGGALSVIGVLKSNREQAELILGDQQTFCQLIVYADAGVGWFVSTYHHGSSPIYDVQVVILEVLEDGTPVTGLQRHIVGTLTSTTWPWPLMQIGKPADVAKTKPRYFRAQVTQRNGTALQDIVVKPKQTGEIEVGFIRLEFNRKAYPPDFSRLPPGATAITIPPLEIARILELRRNQPSALP